MSDQTLSVHMPVQLRMWTVPNFISVVDPKAPEAQPRTIALKDMDPETLSHYLDKHREAVFRKACIKDPKPITNPRRV